MPPTNDPDIEPLRTRWTHLYASHLPALAQARDPIQTRWPVHLDHCFARIILDNAVGVDKSWNRVVKAPAVRNMTVEQLRDALALGEKVARGEVDLVELDQRSLGLRGKKGGKVGGVKGGVGGKRKIGVDGEISKYFATSGESPEKKRVKTEMSQTEEAPKEEEEEPPSLQETSSPLNKDPDPSVQIARITATKTLTPFRKQTLILLCKIPRGRYTTYQAISDHISATSHNTCARAVGNAMRNNPFAPKVPCHRVLSSDGSIGGFNGFWGEDGKFAGVKRDLLAGEGVVFDGRGRVVGSPWRFGA